MARDEATTKRSNQILVWGEMQLGGVLPLSESKISGNMRVAVGFRGAFGTIWPSLIGAVRRDGCKLWARECGSSEPQHVVTQ